jgi:hypothetical protein
MYSEFDDDFPQKNGIYKNFNSTVTVLGNFLESSHISSVFKPKFMFYSLFLVIYERLFGFTEQEADTTGKIDIQKSLESLEQFCVKYVRSDFDPVFKAKFKQSTGNVAQRKYRHSELSKLIL